MRNEGRRRKRVCVWGEGGGGASGGLSGTKHSGGELRTPLHRHTLHLPEFISDADFAATKDLGCYEKQNKMTKCMLCGCISTVCCMHTPLC